MSKSSSVIKRSKRILTDLLITLIIVNMLFFSGQYPVFAADMVNNEFTIQVDNSTGGVYILKKTNDAYNTNYVVNPTSNSNFNINDSRWFGDLTFRYRLNGGEWIDNVTSLSDDVRSVTQDGTQITVSYLSNSANTYGIKNMQLTEKYTLNSNYMQWDITVKNTSGQTMEIGDLGLPLNFNQHWNSTQDVSYTQRVVRHSFVGKHGSYIVWERPNGEGPFLIMFPINGTSLEFKDKCRRNEGPFAMDEPRFEGLTTYFINSLWVSQNRAGAYLPATSTVLSNGASKTFSFKFRWCTNEAAVQDILYQEGLIDVSVAPGMTTTADLPVKLDLHTKKTINSITAQYPSETSITRTGGSNDHNIYTISFSHLGQNNITVNYGNNETTVLQFYVIEPLETLINNRAQFIVNKQQENNSSKGWYKAFMQWDMLNKRTVTRETWNPSGEWIDWHTGGSDDLGYAGPVFLSEKNIYNPVQSEIKALEDYLRYFIWGKMQRTDTFEVYRFWNGSNPNNTGTWRSYNYMHLANIYFNMYRISKLHGMTSYLSKNDYLLRAYNTLMAMYTYNMDGDGGNKWGMMGESSMPMILQALQDEGFTNQYNNLRAKYQAKVNYMTGTAYPFGSEMPYDTTGYESAYTAAVYSNNTTVLERIKKATVATRGSQPLWYFYGTDLRWMGESWWNVSYETQLGGMLLQDYCKRYPSSTQELLRLAYGSYMAGFANINSGQISSDPANKYASSWVYQSEKGASEYSTVPTMSNTNGWWSWTGEADLGLLGGLKMAASDVVNDPIFGLIGYGCTVSQSGTNHTVVPKDGIRQRINMFNLGIWMELEQDKFTSATISSNKNSVAFTLENRKSVAHSTKVSVEGLNPGTYNVAVNGTVVGSAVVGSDRKLTYNLNVGTAASYNITIQQGSGSGSTTVRYEAENGTVNHANIYNSGNASNGRYVGGIDYSDSYVDFFVNVPTAGSYKMTIRYANGTGSNSTQLLGYNGGPWQTVTYPPTAGWGQFGTVTVNGLNLNAGQNIIRLNKGSTGYAELDYIDIELGGSVVQTIYEAENGTVNHANIYNGGNASNGKYVGGIDYSDSYVDFYVNAPAAGSYTMTIRYANGTGTNSTQLLGYNGGPWQTVTYPPTAGWGQFGTVTVTGINLNAGQNIIRLNKGSTGYAELDYISFNFQ